MLTATNPDDLTEEVYYLIPVSEHAGLAAGLADAMNGMFVLHHEDDAATLPVNPQDFIFVMFSEDTMIIARYKDKVADEFEYAYGMAMRSVEGMAQIDRTKIKHIILGQVSGQVSGQAVFSTIVP